MTGTPSQTFVVDGVMYTQTSRLDSRYLNMIPIVCFQPNLVSTAPSASPSTFYPLQTKVQISQTIGGVTLAVASTPAGQSAITAALAASAGVPPSAITITSITASTRRHLRASLSSSSWSTSSESLSSSLSSDYSLDSSSNKATDMSWWSLLLPSTTTSSSSSSTSSSFSRNLLTGGISVKYTVTVSGDPP